MYRGEIGSEFWDNKIKDAPDQKLSIFDQGYSRYYLSGRTSLDAIVSDILSYKKCKTAYLPSYCCHTMIEPFLRHGIQVDFYDVIVTNAGIKVLIDKDHPCDIVLFMNYFGYKMPAPELPENAIAVQDITHGLTQRMPQKIDYAYASFRKWGAVAAAGMAAKFNDDWCIPDSKATNEKYVSLRNRAYMEKMSYMSCDSNDKEVFLRHFAEAEELLETDGIGYSADTDSLEKAKHIPLGYQQRKDNACYLLDNMCFTGDILPIFNCISEDDTPLFFPVLVKNGKRDDLRDYLIEKNIYCPVHWPKTDLHRVSSKSIPLFDEEISIVCDQRYSDEDMERICYTIKDYYNRNRRGI